MKDILLKNIEKVILTSLLVILAASAVYMITTMDRKKLVLITNDKGQTVPSKPVKSVEVEPAKLEEDKAQPYDSKGYIYCRSLDCNYLIHKSLPKCPWCDTDVKAPIDRDLTVDKDSDGDGITDGNESKYGLNPQDPSDAIMDEDIDGFSNIDEINYQTDLNDKEDHPSIINRCNLHSRIKVASYYPITLSNFAVNDEADKKTWDIYADIYTKRGVKSIFKRVNDKIDEIDYTITDVGKEDGREFLIIQKEGEEPVKIFSGRKRTVKSIDYILVDNINKKIVRFQINSHFELDGLGGSKEKYKAIKYDSSKKTMTVIDYKSKSKVEISVNPILDEPGKVKENSIDSLDRILE